MRAPRICTLLVVLLLALPAVLVGAPPAAGQSTNPVNVLTLDLGNLGMTGGWVSDVNPAGVVAGMAYQATPWEYRPFSYDLLTGGPMVDLGALQTPAPTHLDAVGVTDAGVIIGHSGYVLFAYDTTAVSPAMVALPFPADAGANPWMDPDLVNDAGWTVGWWGDDTDPTDDYRAFVYDPLTNVTTSLGYFGYDWALDDVNDAAVPTAVGSKKDGDTWTAFVQPLDGDRIDLNTTFGWSESYAFAIADDGTVTGEYCDDTIDLYSDCGTGEWTGFVWNQANAPIELPGASGKLINDDWIVAEAHGYPARAIAYARADLTQPPIEVGGMIWPTLLSDDGVVVGTMPDYSAPGVYDLGATSPEMLPLPTLGGPASYPAAVERVGDHTIIVGSSETGALTDTGQSVIEPTAWVLGVPDAPTIGLVADADGIDPVAGVTADQTPTLSGTAEPSGPVVVRRDGVVLDTVVADPTTGVWSFTSASLLDATYTFTATYEPATGWPSNPAAMTVTVETIPAPTVTLGTAKVRGSTVTVPFTVSGSYVPESLTCQLDAATPVPCTSTTEHTFTEVAKGDHEVTVRAATTAGRVGAGSTTLTVKSGKFTEPAPPSELTVAITGVTTSKNGPVTVTFVADGGTPPYTFTCALVGGTTNVLEPCTSPWTYSEWLAAGKYTLTVTVLDEAIPEGSASVTTTINVRGAKS